MDRGDVDNAAPLGLDHSWQNGAGHQPYGFQVDGKHILPLRFGHLGRVGVGVFARIVHKARDRAELDNSLRNRARNIRGLGHISRQRQPVYAQSRPHDDVKRGDVCPFLQRFLHCGCANAATATCHQHMMPGKPPHHQLPQGG